MPYTKMDSAGYSMFKTPVSVFLSAIILVFIKKEKQKINLACVLATAGSGTLSYIANWMMLVALYTLPASVQYPFITGSTMIVSTVISLFLAKNLAKGSYA